MSLPNQTSHFSYSDRYPNVFGNLRNLLGKKIKILSFGCSYGYETKILATKYFPEASAIHGLDINKTIIATNQTQNLHPVISYFSDISELDDDYDLILCMSVLCLWPPEEGHYSFQLFNETLTKIDQLVKVNGHLCIYNAGFRFTDSAIAHRYELVSTPSKHSSNCVVKRNPAGLLIQEPFPFFLFRKMNSAV